MIVLLVFNISNPDIITCSVNSLGFKTNKKYDIRIVEVYQKSILLFSKRIKSIKF